MLCCKKKQKQNDHHHKKKKREFLEGSVFVKESYFCYVSPYAFYRTLTLKGLSSKKGSSQVPLWITEGSSFLLGTFPKVLPFRTFPGQWFQLCNSVLRETLLKYSTFYTTVKSVCFVFKGQWFPPS